MKYICLGYIEDKYFLQLTEQEQRNFMDACFVYDEELQKKGHWIGGEALQPVSAATTVRFRNGKPQITDGPFAETKEYLGGIMILEALDLNEAIQLMSRHPSLKMGGTFEIRPSADLSALAADSKRRRAANQPDVAGKPPAPSRAVGEGSAAPEPRTRPGMAGAD